MTEITINGLRWASFIFSYIYKGDQYYMVRERNEELNEVIIERSIKFLNKWGCRITNIKIPYICRMVKKQILTTDLTELSNEKLETTNLDNIKSLIYDLFNRIDDIEEIGSTGVSKLLYILVNQKLFVMWDEAIAEKYECSLDADGYFKFLKEMQKRSKDICKQVRNPAELLTTELRKLIPDLPRKTLAKYLDEYNWITITKEITCPPQWRP